MKRFIISGLLVFPAFLLLNTQAESVADTAPLASTLGVESSTTLSAPAVRPKPRSTQTLRQVVQTVHAAPTERNVLPMQEAIAASSASDAHKEIANGVLQALPEKCRDTLQSFYVKYTKQKSRGLAGKSVMILDGTVRNENEFRALFIHETGHNWDLGCLTGTPASGFSTFMDGDTPIYNDDPSVEFYKISWLTSEAKRSYAKPEDFISAYGASNVFEEFAETFAYFVLHNDEFKKLALDNETLKKKYLWFRDVVFDGEIPQVATGHSPYKENLWDVTKVTGYTWHDHQH